MKTQILSLLLVGVLSTPVIAENKKQPSGNPNRREGSERMNGGTESGGKPYSPPPTMSGPDNGTNNGGRNSGTGSR